MIFEVGVSARFTFAEIQTTLYSQGSPLLSRIPLGIRVYGLLEVHHGVEEGAHMQESLLGVGHSKACYTRVVRGFSGKTKPLEYS